MILEFLKRFGAKNGKSLSNKGLFKNFIRLFMYMWVNAWMNGPILVSHCNFLQDGFVRNQLAYTKINILKIDIGFKSLT
jgi:hypothetical protein